MRVLDIDVPASLVARWRGWLAPAWQPFFVDDVDGWPSVAAPPGGSTSMTDELRDTYTVWRLRGPRDRVVWFDEVSFLALPRADRASLVRSQAERRRGAVPSVRRWSATFGGEALRRQADGHRFVWWPSLVDRAPEAVLAGHVEDGQPASRHREVRAATWRACRDVLPAVEALAGTFAPSGVANCFGTTLAAVGAGEGDERVVQAPFEAFLASRCVPGGDDRSPGTVLVWRDRDGQPFHSAVTIGDGWAFEKPAQTWWTPRVVLEVRQLVAVNRSVGLRLERHRLVSAG